MEEPVKLSVIVPAYNCEHTLTECVQSILNQDEASMEILLVDDGSTDNTPAICDSLAKLEDRIRVIHQKNQGLSAARNVALQQARGRYISFVDADDSIEPNTYRYNIEWLDSHADYCVLQFPCTEKHVKGETAKIRYRYSENIIGEENLFEEWLVTKRIANYVWNKIFRRSFIQCFSFPEGWIFEDRYLMANILQSCNYVHLSDVGLYNYYKVKGQLTERPVERNAFSLFHADCHIATYIVSYIHVSSLNRVYYEKLNNCIYYLGIIKREGKDISKEQIELLSVFPTVMQLLRFRASFGLVIKLLMVHILGLDRVLKMNI